MLGVNETAPVKRARDSFNLWLRSCGEPQMVRTTFEEAILRKPGIYRKTQRTKLGEMYGGFSLLPEQNEFEAEDGGENYTEN